MKTRRDEVFFPVRIVPEVPKYNYRTMDYSETLIIYHILIDWVKYLVKYATI